MKRAIFCVMLFTSAALVMAADKTADVRDLMTAREFHATGLDKLSPDELAALNAWLASYAAHAPAAATSTHPAAAPSVSPEPAVAVVAAPTPAPPASTADSFGKSMIAPKPAEEPKRIETRILGTFTGWTGNTVFKLENGQVWKQADSRSYQTHLENPEVVIKKLMLGYLLTLPGQSASVFVKRIQ